MTVFADTSGILAAMNVADEHHLLAIQSWQRFQVERITLLTSNYVVVETIMLLGRRLGTQAVRDFITSILPLIEVHWIDQATHARAVAALLAAGQRRLSLVDCVSFEVMRDLGITDAFTFDSDFQRQGFRTIP